MSRASKLLFVVTEDWYFWSHRLAIARAARDAGYQVMVATRVKAHGERIRREGFGLVPLNIVRESRNPWTEFGTIRELVQICRREVPDIVHLVALKPIIYGALACSWAAPDAQMISAIAGIGYLGTSSSFKARILRPFVGTAFRLIFNSPRMRVLVQNPEDENLFKTKLIRDAARISVIRGAGVDTRAFCPTPEPDGVPVVVLAGRMLTNKGVAEFVSAASIVVNRGLKARFLLVGGLDEASPAAIKESQLLAWNQGGVVEWHGHIIDMSLVFGNASVVCLPSYREGLPKVLIEAMAAGRPVVSTDVAGCREAVRHGINGLLVPARDPVALADAVEQLIRDPQMRARMGRNGREIAIREFSEEVIIRQTLALYHQLGPETGAGAEVLSDVC